MTVVLKHAVFVSTTLTLPVFWIAQAWGGFYITPVHELLTWSRGPQFLTSHSTCLTADTFVEINNES